MARMACALALFLLGLPARLHPQVHLDHRRRMPRIIIRRRQHVDEEILSRFLLARRVVLVLNIKLVLALVVLYVLLEFLEPGRKRRPVIWAARVPDVDVARVGDRGNDGAGGVPLRCECVVMTLSPGSLGHSPHSPRAARAGLQAP
jgi:hypothetical protein